MELMTGLGAFQSRARECGISKGLVQNVVAAFYDKVRAGAVLGPVFEDTIGVHWDAHLERIVRFWLTAAMIERCYDGRDFMSAHMKHPSIRSEHIRRWLLLFQETLADHCSPGQAEAFLDIANRMADNIELSLKRRDRQGSGDARRKNRHEGPTDSRATTSSHALAR
jgi:hemoglobin